MYAKALRNAITLIRRIVEADTAGPDCVSSPSCSWFRLPAINSNILTATSSSLIDRLLSRHISVCYEILQKKSSYFFD